MSAADNLELIVRTAADLSRQSVVLYGPGKTGKSSTVIKLAQMPELAGQVVFGDAENGLGAASGPIATIDTARDLDQFIRRVEQRVLHKQKIPRIVVLDGLDRLYMRVVDQVADEHGLTGDQYGRAHGQAGEQLFHLLMRFHALPTIKIVTAHPREFVLETSGRKATKVRISFDLPTRMRERLETLWDVVLYCNIGRSGRTEVIGCGQISGQGTTHSPTRQLFAGDRFALATDGRFDQLRQLTPRFLFDALQLAGSAAPAAEDGQNSLADRKAA